MSNLATQKIEILKSKNGLLIKLIGQINYLDAKVVRAAVTAIKMAKTSITLDFSELKSIDYSSFILIIRALSNKKHEFTGMNDKLNSMLALIRDKNIDTTYQPAQNKLNLLERLGEKICEGFKNLLELGAFLGETIIKSAKIVLMPTNLRLRELSNYIKDAGVNAVFIVALTAFLIGVVLAYLGSSMLASFGASIFIVEIMGMLTLREVAPLIAAIVVAGRSASSFTAQIGAMKITEELDAMRTMGFDPFNFLVLPRIIAMVLSLPIIIFIADAIGIFGQMIVCQTLLDISFADYLGRFNEMVDLRHFWVGIIKAPFFGAMIAIIGCMRGFEVGLNAQSLGEKTTISVVNAIFWVIALDAFFAVIFMWINI